MFTENGTEATRRIQWLLFTLQDKKYRDFQCGLMPTVAPHSVIGVRMPALRNLASEIAKTPTADDFLNVLPHKYYEENNLHGLLISRMRSFEDAVTALDKFLPYVDNWATCDIISPKIFKKYLPELYIKIKEWIASGRTYTVRFAIGMLMSFYLDDAFSPEYADLVAAVRSDEYYVNMMIAWYFATALAKQPKAATPYIEERRLDKWTHNKTISKAIESYRVTDEQKEYLRTLRIK